MGTGALSRSVLGVRATPRWVAAHVRYISVVAALVGLYYATAHIGYALDFAGPVASIVWLPVGVAIAFLYCVGLQFWPGVMIGDLLVNNYSTLPVGSAVGQSIGNLLEALLATMLMRHLIGRRSRLESIGQVMKLALALAAGTLLSAAVGSLSLRLGGVVAPSALGRVARTWWLGDLCGALIVVPLALAWRERPDLVFLRRSWIEIVLGLGVLVAVSALVFRSGNPLNYLVFPPLIWAALRQGQRGATLAISVAAAFAVWATTNYIGPFHSHSLARSVLETQLFIAIAAVSTLSLAAVVSERERFAGGLWDSRVRLVGAVDAERRRLEHNLHDGAQLRLTALLIRLGLAEDDRADAPPSTRALLARIQNELAIVIDDLRQISHGKHPRVLTEQGLSAAVEQFVHDTDVPIECLELPCARFHPATEATGYYVISEAVTNAQRHARAPSIQLRVHLAHEFLHIEVVDTGVGNAVEIDGHGLQGLRDRVETFGGTFEVSSPPRHGTRVRATIPVDAAARAHGD